jgi:hypothetical protein
MRAMALVAVLECVSMNLWGYVSKPSLPWGNRGINTASSTQSTTRPPYT